MDTCSRCQETNPEMTCLCTNPPSPLYHHYTQFHSILLPTNHILVPIPPPGPLARLAEVKPELLSLLCVDSGALCDIPLSTPLPVDDKTKYIWAGRRLFGCGGGAPRGRKEAWEIDGSLVNLQWKPDMLTPRWGHGLWFDERRGEILVFGGLSFVSPLHTANPDTAVLQECEVLTQIWQDLPTMQEGRAHFTPCACQGSVFLCGGFNTKTIEIYHLKDASYRKLPFTTPERGPTVAGIDRHTLVIFSTQQKREVSLRSGLLVDHCSRRLVDSTYLQPKMNPVIDRTGEFNVTTAEGRFVVIHFEDAHD